jgi:hypothetical protein
MVEAPYYRDKRMSLEPINMSVREAVMELADGKSLWLIFEPGDATRYTLLIGKASNWNAILVARTHTDGEFMAGITIPVTRIKHPVGYLWDVMTNLSNGNSWSGTILHAIIANIITQWNNVIEEREKYLVGKYLASSNILCGGSAIPAADAHERGDAVGSSTPEGE